MNRIRNTARWRIANPDQHRLPTRGLTLIELVVVLVVLVALGALLVPLFGNLGEDSREQATRATLARTAQAIVGTGGYEQVMRHATDAGNTAFGDATGLPWPGPDEIGARQDHPQLVYLFQAPVDDEGPPVALMDYDPVTRIGWNGPWIDVTTATTYAVNTSNGFTTSYGLNGDLAPLDGWGNPVVIQLPNADPDEVENARLISAGPNGVLDTPGDVLEPSVTQKNDDLVLYLYREDPSP